MPKRVALTSLLPSANAALNTSTPPAQSPAPSTELDAALSAPAVESAKASSTSPGPKDVPKTKMQRASTQADSGHRHYSELVRKEARLRDDQVDALATHARRLSRAKTGSDERITDNTLIRIAVDLLLRESPQLVGSTEQQLRESVGL